MKPRNVIMVIVMMLMALGTAPAWAGQPKAFLDVMVEAPPMDALAMRQAGTLLHDQSGDGVPGAVVCQDYEAGFSGFDAQCADDFTVPAGPDWVIEQIDLVGNLTALDLGAVPSFTVDLAVYADSSGTPGALVAQMTETPVVTGGTLTVTLTSPLRLDPGTYWMSVEANLAFGANENQWAWGVRKPGVVYDGLWRNPNGGWLTGCTSWGPFYSCLGVDADDFRFALRGSMPQATLSLSKTADATNITILPNDVTYTLTLENTSGTEDAFDVEVSDPLDPTMPFDSATCSDGTFGFEGTTWVWTVGDLPAGDVVTCDLTVNVTTGTTDGDHDNTATASAANAASAIGAETVSVSIGATPVDLAVSKTGPSVVTPGETFGYTIEVSNDDTTTAASGVVVTDRLPEWLTYDSDSCGGSEDAGVWTWTVGSIATSSSEPCTLSVMLAAGATGSVSNTASAVSDNPPVTVANLSSTHTFDVAEADLAITITDPTPGVLTSGDTRTLEVELSNDGPDDATGIDFHIVMPSGLDHVSDTCGFTQSEEFWYVDGESLAASTSDSCEVVVEATGSVEGESVVVEASITDVDQVDPDSGNDDDSVSLGIVAHTGTDGVQYSYATSEAASGAPTYSWVDVSGGTAINFADDDGEVNVALPFGFSFYGTTYTSVRVGNNGGLLFAGSGDVPFNNQMLPVDGLAGPLMAVFWDDLDDTAGDVYYKGYTAPCPNTEGGTGACFVVEWQARPHVVNRPDTTFEVILYDTGNVLYQYADVQFSSSTFSWGRLATVGIQGPSGTPTMSLAYSYNTEFALADSFAILFSATDAVPPVGPTNVHSTSHTVNAYVNDDQIDMAWTAATDANPVVYYVLFDTNPTTVPPASGPIAGTSASSAALGDGLHYFHIRACDSFDNCGATVHAGPYGIDTVPPTNPSGVTSSSHASPSQQPVIDIEWTTGGSDLTTAVSGYSAVFDDFATTPCNDTLNLGASAMGVSSNPLVGGSYYLHLCTRDLAGNWSDADHYGPFEVLPDVPPTVTNVGGVAGLGASTPTTQVTLAFSEAMAEPGASSDTSYLLVGAGPDGILDTLACTAPVDDDVEITLDSVDYDESSMTAALSVGPDPLGAGLYRVFACASELEDLQGNPLDGDGNGTGGDNFVDDFTLPRDHQTTNPNFDADASGWTSSPGGFSFDGTVDAGDSPFSGSAKATATAALGDVFELSQCVSPPSFGDTLWVSGMVRLDVASGGDPVATVNVEFFDDSICSGTSLGTDAASPNVIGDTAMSFTEITDVFDRPVGANSVMLTYTVTANAGGPSDFDMWFDVLTASASASGDVIFADGFETGTTSKWSSVVPTP